MKNKCIICDLDGTLAIFNGKRSPYDCSRCHEIDDLNPAVFEVIKLIDFRNALRENILKGVCDIPKTEIILLSGRDSKFRPQTTLWLQKHQVPYSNLYMRIEGDRRNDAIIKRELFNEHISGKYDVSFVLDDRDRVVSLWRRDLGLHCFQVNYGDF